MVTVMQKYDYIVESEEISWLSSWIEQHEREYDVNVRRLQARILVVVGVLGLLWASVGFGSSVAVTSCAIAIFFSCYSSVLSFFDNYLSRNQPLEVINGMSDMSLAITVASIFPLMLW